MGGAGAGGLAVQVVDVAVLIETVIRDSTFAFNKGVYAETTDSENIGVAGAIRVAAKVSDNGTTNHLRVETTQFISNYLPERCTGRFCMAGALAVTGTVSHLTDCLFESNHCPRSPGGLYTDSTMELDGCVLRNNTAAVIKYLQ